MAGVHRQAVAVLGGAAQAVDVGDVEFGVDAVHEQVHRQVDDVDVAGALAVAEQRALDTVGAGHHAELGGRHGAAAVVVRVQRDDHGVALLDRAAEPLDHVAVHVGGVALDGRRQVEDDRPSGVGSTSSITASQISIAKSGSVSVKLSGEYSYRTSVSTSSRSSLRHSFARADGDVDDPVLVEAEHDLALQRVGRVVEVDDRPRCALQALVRALDQLLAALREHLDRDVVGDPVLLDQLADEVEVGLARRREADLDLLEAHRDQFFEHPQLAGRVHRVDEGLVAVAQVDRAPQRCLVDDRRSATCGR